VVVQALRGRLRLHLPEAGDDVEPPAGALLVLAELLASLSW
jgi:hypothetical protein